MLINFVGGSMNAGDNLKEAGSALWQLPITFVQIVMALQHFLVVTEMKSAPVHSFGSLVKDIGGQVQFLTQKAPIATIYPVEPLRSFP